MTMERIVAAYYVETPHPVEYAAEILAGEQSCGTFVRVAGESDELRARFRARVERITPLEPVETPSLPGSRPPRNAAARGRYHRAEIAISFPLENMGLNLPVLVSTVAGNLFEMSEFSGLRLLDVELPPAFASAYPGPQFGVEGTRKLTGARRLPVLGTIVKPSVGLTPDQTARLVRGLAEAGIDFIKDDELMADPPHSPLGERVKAVMRVINDVAERTGKKVMYAFNVSDAPDAMLRHHETVVNAGGTCVMASLNSVGFAGVIHLRSRCQLPIHGHRNGWGMLTRCPALGIAFTAYQKLWRVAGVDHLHVNGFKNKFWEPDESVEQSIKACLTPLFGGYQAMPVISSGQWGGQAPETLRRTGTTDVMYLAGGGIMAHPGGPAAGLAAIRQAWEAALAGVPLETYAKDHRELKQSLETFGRAAPDIP